MNRKLLSQSVVQSVCGLILGGSIMSHMTRILVIDDEDAIRDIIKFTLAEEGFVVFDAKNGAEGLEVLKNNPVDVVITDILMPEMGGVAAIGQIRQSYPQTRIIAMSGGRFTNNFCPLEMARDIGADMTLPKPFNLDELLAVIETVIAETPDKELIQNRTS